MTAFVHSVPKPAPQIARDPRIVGGEPHVLGTRVPVSAVVVMYVACERDLDLVRRKLPTLPAGGVEVALDYYAKHRDEIDRLIEESDRDAYS